MPLAEYIRYLGNMISSKGGNWATIENRRNKGLSEVSTILGILGDMGAHRMRAGFYSILFYFQWKNYSIILHRGRHTYHCWHIVIYNTISVLALCFSAPQRLGQWSAVSESELYWLQGVFFLFWPPPSSKKFRVLQDWLKFELNMSK